MLQQPAGACERRGPALSAAAAHATAAAYGAAHTSCSAHAHPACMDVDQRQMCGAWEPLGAAFAGSSGLLHSVAPCSSSSPPAVALGYPTEEMWAAAPAVPEPALWRRQRSLTPDDAPAEDAESCERSPITPTATATLATPSPHALAPCPMDADGEADGEAAGARRAATAAALWRRIESFMHVLSSSPLVQSALLSLELSGAFPAATEPGLPAAQGLEWTMSQLLAMHIKAGGAVATEHSLLASLWLLESMESVWRSPATVCLNDYLKHLAVFSPEAVVAITADWKASFRALRAGVVDAQMDLLQRLDWRVRLDPTAEVYPCCRLLFRMDAGGPKGMMPAAGGQPCSLRDAWAARMRRLVVTIAHKAHLLGKPAAPHAPPSVSCRLAEGYGREMAPKRQRIQA